MRQDLSPLVPSSLDITCGSLAVLVFAFSIATLIMVIKNERNLTHRILAALVVCCFPIIGPLGYFLWRRSDAPSETPPYS